MTQNYIYTARFHHRDGTVKEAEKTTVEGQPQRMIQDRKFGNFQIEDESWRIRGPVKRLEKVYDYVPLQTPVDSDELKMTGPVVFHFSHPKFESYATSANMDIDGEPKFQFELFAHRNNGVRYDDPELTIEPNPHEKSAGLLSL